MPLSMVHESPLSVRVTGWLTVTLATFGAEVGAGAAEAKTTGSATNAELMRIRNLDIMHLSKQLSGCFSFLRRTRICKRLRAAQSYGIRGDTSLPNRFPC